LNPKKLINSLLLVHLDQGKTSLGKHLAKKYSSELVSDTDWKTMARGILNSKRTIIEGAGLADLYLRFLSLKLNIIKEC